MQPITQHRPKRLEKKGRIPFGPRGFRGSMGFKSTSSSLMNSLSKSSFISAVTDGVMASNTLRVVVDCNLWYLIIGRTPNIFTVLQLVWSVWIPWIWIWGGPNLLISNPLTNHGIWKSLTARSSLFSRFSTSLFLGATSSSFFSSSRGNTGSSL